MWCIVRLFRTIINNHLDIGILMVLEPVVKIGMLVVWVVFRVGY